MPSEDSTFRPAMKLMAGRMAAFAITFLTPVLLVRVFNQAEFGTYKQFFLVTSTPYLVGCAFSECLFYFLPKDPDRGGRYVVNTVLMLIAIGGMGAAALLVNASRIAAWMNNAALAPYIPIMGVYLLLLILGTALEITMISRKKYSMASGVYVASDLLRAVFLVAPALITRSLAWALVGSVVFLVIRVCGTFAYFKWEFKEGMRFDKALIREQWKYTIPYALAGIVNIIQTNYHQYAVSFHFDAATFAIYSVGCLQIPLIDFLATPTSSVMMVRMSEKLRDGRLGDVIEIWRDTTRKLGLLFIPFTALLLVNAHSLITFLFTTAYAASVPIFIVWSLSILLVTFQTDGVLRVFAEIRYLFVTNAVRLVMLFALMGWFLTKFQLMGAVMITLAGMVLAKVMALHRVRQVLKCGYGEFLPWRSLGGTLVAAMVAAIPALFVNAKLAAPLIVLLPVSGMTYVAAYASMVLVLGLLSKDEISAIKSMVLPQQSPLPGGASEQ